MSCGRAARPVLRLLFTAGIAAGLLTGSAAMTTGTLLLALRDSRSGGAVRPEQVLIDGAPVSVGEDSPGLLSVELGGGQHQIQVRAPGYSPFEATVSVDGDQTPVNTFELDREPSASGAEELPPLDNRLAVIEGHVVESIVGRFIPGVQVSVGQSGPATRTDEQGYFALPVSVPGAKPEGPSIPARVDLKIAGDGFAAEERRNVEIISGTTMTITVELERPTSGSESIKVVDESRGQRRYSSWRFDVMVD